MTIYTAKIDELIEIIEYDLIGLNRDIKLIEYDLIGLNRDIERLNTQKQVYLKLLGDLKDLKAIE